MHCEVDYLERALVAYSLDYQPPKTVICANECLAPAIRHSFKTTHLTLVSPFVDDGAQDQLTRCVRRRIGDLDEDKRYDLGICVGGQCVDHVLGHVSFGGRLLVRGKLMQECSRVPGINCVALICGNGIKGPMHFLVHRYLGCGLRSYAQHKRAYAVFQRWR